MISLSDTSITAGETVRVALRVENTGTRDGTFVEELIVDGEVVASKSVAVEAGGTGTMVFERRFDEPDEYEIAAGETSLGTLTVMAASDEATGRNRTGVGDADGSSIEVVEATVPADWVKEGFNTTARATVTNTAPRTATRTLTVTVDGRSVANATVTLRPNERDVVTIEFEAVDGTIAIEGVDAGRIEVSEDRGERGTDAGAAAGDSGRGFENGLVVLVVVVGILAAGTVHVALRYD